MDNLDSPKKITSHRQLRVWQDAVDAAMKIFEWSKAFPPEERYSLTDQMRKSSRSVAANISEAWGRRRYRAAFISKLNEVEGEIAETDTWLEICLRCGYFSKAQVEELILAYHKILGQVIVMLSRPDVWTLKTKS